MIFCSSSKIEDLRKLIKVAESCHSKEHCKSALRYLVLFMKKHRVGEKGPFFTISMRICDYLLDTREHVEHGYHKPAYNGFKTVNTYPSMRNYLRFEE
jgi:hypothetical protein